MEFKIRRFQSADEPSLQRMVKQFYLEDAADEPMNEEKVKRTIMALGDDSTAGAILMVEGAPGILGYAIVIHYWSNEYGGWLAFLDELFIDQAYRGFGLGSNLIKHITQEYGEQIIGTGLEVLPHNTRALQLYLRLGFEPDGRYHLLHLRE